MGKWDRGFLVRGGDRESGRVGEWEIEAKQRFRNTGEGRFGLRELLG